MAQILGARSSSSKPSGRRSAAATRRRATTRTPTPTSCWAAATRELIERAGIDAGEVEDVIAGCVQQYGEQMFNVGRNAWLQAGLPIETPATTVDRQCGSAQQAVNFAAALIAAASTTSSSARASSTWATSRWRRLRLGRRGRHAFRRS